MNVSTCRKTFWLKTVWQSMKKLVGKSVQVTVKTCTADWDVLQNISKNWLQWMIVGKTEHTSVAGLRLLFRWIMVLFLKVWKLSEYSYIVNRKSPFHLWWSTYHQEWNIISNDPVPDGPISSTDTTKITLVGCIYWLFLKWNLLHLR
jgi:hypothetical protein